jgi:hypothetical protein
MNEKTTAHADNVYPGLCGFSHILAGAMAE